jgi:hypothetical protein
MGRGFSSHAITEAAGPPPINVCNCLLIYLQLYFISDDSQSHRDFSDDGKTIAESFRMVF